ncbi:MAG: 16S rRNA (cytosine(1402)-N(4))-methyltransferase RsmH [Planctomycetota bacterium]
MTIHIPVLPTECIEALDISDGDTVVDGTFGGGGHSRLILDKVGDQGHLIGMDRDPAVVAAAEEWVPENATLIASNYANLPEHLDQMEIESVDGILLDLGLSSDQLADRDRGFSFQSDGPLDLRFDPTAGEPAWRLVNRLGEKHLANVIYEFGEEKLSRRIARKIVGIRHQNPIRSASQLADVVRSCVPRSRKQNIDPATRTFQALRIAVNEELKWLSVAMRRLPERLASGGRMAVISFHSLEDRIVKTSFADDTSLKILTKKPLMATEDELSENPRARSAKLRIVEKR